MPIDHDAEKMCSSIRENVRSMVENVLRQQGFHVQRFEVYVTFPPPVNDLDQRFHQVNVELRGRSSFGDLLWRHDLYLAPPFYTDPDYRGDLVCSLQVGGQLERDLKTMAMRHASFNDLRKGTLK